jgi:hypothetical protein
MKVHIHRTNALLELRIRSCGLRTWVKRITYRPESSNVLMPCSVVFDYRERLIDSEPEPMEVGLHADSPPGG